jgi:hypothetical protein
MLQSIKLTVVEMVSNASNYLQNIFGFSKAEDISSDNKNTGEAFMGLVVMVVMVVLLKRI